MVANVAVDLGISPDSINIKGKTNEKLGYLGRQGTLANHPIQSGLVPSAELADGKTDSGPTSRRNDSMYPEPFRRR